MAPAAVEADIPVHSKSQSREPLKLSGALKDVEHFDVTPAIGREFPKARAIRADSTSTLRDSGISSPVRWLITCNCAMFGAKHCT